MKKEKTCCRTSIKKPKSFWLGLIYGLIPHSFCIAFIIFTIIGVTTATIFFQKILIIPYFFQILIGLSFVFATISAIIYLKKLNLLSLLGIKKKWRYLIILYGTTISINIFFFFVIFPYLANIDYRKDKSTVLSQQINLSSIILTVDIPCPGHAPLIINELRKIPGIQSVFFQYPNSFIVSYNSKKISPERILQIEIFKNFKATTSSFYK